MWICRFANMKMCKFLSVSELKNLHICTSAHSHIKKCPYPIFLPLLMLK